MVKAKHATLLVLTSSEPFLAHAQQQALMQDNVVADTAYTLLAWLLLLPGLLLLVHYAAHRRSKHK